MSRAERKALIRERHLALIAAGRVRDPRRAQRDALMEAEYDAAIESVEHPETECLVIEANDKDE